MSTPKYFDNRKHRKNQNYSSSTFKRRILWMLLQPLFSLSPRLFYSWRNGLLRFMGAEIGEEVRIYPSVRITFPWNLQIGNYSTIGPKVELYCLGKVSIGAHVLISQQAHLCAGTHDYKQINLPLETPPITIRDEAWLCANSFVGPGVVVGQGAVVGACAVVFKSIEEAHIVVGNPSRVVGQRSVKP